MAVEGWTEEIADAASRLPLSPFPNYWSAESLYPLKNHLQA